MVAAWSYALLSLTTYENGWYHLKCSQSNNSNSNGDTGSIIQIDLCCQQAFPDDALLHHSCRSHAVTLPAIPTVPNVVSFFDSGGNETKNNNNNISTNHRRRIWRDGTWRDEEEEGAAWTAQLVGVGMHRDLQFHRTGGETTQKSSDASTSSSDLPFVLYLPAGLFLNVEEHGDDITILNTAPTIDQEEPAFASIPHGLVVILPQDNIPSWTLHLHARYPMPGGDAASQHVVFPVQQQQLIVWDVAAPSAADTWPVLITTVALALLGAVVSFRDIARVVRWV